jgi:hypothetical protein
MHVDAGHPFVKDIHDSSPVVTLRRVAGWESTTINGRKRWRLTDDRRDELCRALHVGSEPRKSLTLIAAEHAAAKALAVAKGQKVAQTLN